MSPSTLAGDSPTPSTWLNYKAHFPSYTFMASTRGEALKEACPAQAAPHLVPRRLPTQRLMHPRAPKLGVGVAALLQAAAKLPLSDNPASPSTPPVQNM